MTLSALQVWSSDISKLIAYHPPLLGPVQLQRPLNVPEIGQAPSPLRVFPGADAHAWNAFAHILPWLTYLSSLTFLFDCYLSNELYLDHTMLNYVPHPQHPCSPFLCLLYS